MYTAVIVDDERLVLVDLRSAFSWNDFGFQLIGEFTKPLEAIEFIRKNKPDVIFTDIKMPKISGIELMNVVKEFHPSCLFAVISGYDEFDYAQKAMRIGAIDYCLKPLGKNDADSVLARMKQRLDKRVSLFPGAEPTDSKTGFDQVLSYISDNITRPLTLDDISNKFFISKNYLCILFKKNLGITCSHYITKEKMKYAEKLMRTTRLTCGQISNAVGYKDYFYFSRVFKKVFGCSPKEYQMRIWRETYEKTD